MTPQGSWGRGNSAILPARKETESPSQNTIPYHPHPLFQYLYSNLTKLNINSIVNFLVSNSFRQVENKILSWIFLQYHPNITPGDSLKILTQTFSNLQDTLNTNIERLSLLLISCSPPGQVLSFTLVSRSGQMVCQASPPWTMATTSSSLPSPMCCPWPAWPFATSGCGGTY